MKYQDFLAQTAEKCVSQKAEKWGSEVRFLWKNHLAKREASIVYGTLGKEEAMCKGPFLAHEQFWYYIKY